MVQIINKYEISVVNVLIINQSIYINGGERGIRTPDTVTRILAFQASPFNRSGTSPTGPNHTC